MTFESESVNFLFSRIHTHTFLSLKHIYYRPASVRAWTLLALYFSAATLWLLMDTAAQSLMVEIVFIPLGKLRRNNIIFFFF